MTDVGALPLIVGAAGVVGVPPVVLPPVVAVFPTVVVVLALVAAPPVLPLSLQAARTVAAASKGNSFVSANMRTVPIVCRLNESPSSKTHRWLSLNVTQKSDASLIGYSRGS